MYASDKLIVSMTLSDTPAYVLAPRCGLTPVKVSHILRRKVQVAEKDIPKVEKLAKLLKLDPKDALIPA